MDRKADKQAQCWKEATVLKWEGIFEDLTAHKKKPLQIQVASKTWTIKDNKTVLIALQQGCANLHFKRMVKVRL